MTALLDGTVAQAPDTDDPVLDAALDAFLDFGIRRTTMGEIARRAGISPATLYRRYAQKSDVVMAVGLREATRTLERIDAAVDLASTPLEQLTTLHLTVSAELRDNALLHRVLATEPETVLPRLTIEAEPVLEMGRGYLAAFLARLQREGHLPAYDVAPVADWMTRLTQSEVLTPSREPLTEGAIRAFVRDHLAPFVRMAVPDVPDATERKQR